MIRQEKQLSRERCIIHWLLFFFFFFFKFFSKRETHHYFAKYEERDRIYFKRKKQAYDVIGQQCYQTPQWHTWWIMNKAELLSKKKKKQKKLFWKLSMILFLISSGAQGGQIWFSFRNFDKKSILDKQITTINDSNKVKYNNRRRRDDKSPIFLPTAYQHPYFNQGNQKWKQKQLQLRETFYFIKIRKISIIQFRRCVTVTIECQKRSHLF